MKCCSKCKLIKPFNEFYKHKEKKDGYRSQCMVCMKQYYQINASVIKERVKQHYYLNLDEVQEYSKQYRKLNKDKLNAKNKERYQTDKGKLNSKNNNKKYAQTLKGKLVKKSSKHKRRVLLKNSTPLGKHWKPQDVIHKLKLQKYNCVYCQTSIKDYHEVDHIIPVSKGGSNEPSNIQLLCKKCNGSNGKGAKLPHEFAQQHGKLF